MFMLFATSTIPLLQYFAIYYVFVFNNKDVWMLNCIDHIVWKEVRL